MAWREQSPMDSRVHFISDYLDGRFTIVDLCQEHGISRRIGYKWIHRYEAEGLRGLEDRSRTPRRCPHKTPDEIVKLILAFRKQHPTWGPKKLLDRLGRRDPGLPWPAESTCADILSRHGLTRGKRRRRRIGHPGPPRTKITAPNQVWTADFKGRFKMRDGLYCYPLTVADACSRYLLGCQALLSTSLAGSRPVFLRLFKEYGLPQRIRTDNGTPFAAVALGRLSQLSAWWLRLGIYPELIEPGKPQQNGRHERMHRTLKNEATRPPSGNRNAQQRRFNRFRDEFNNERPHEALGQETPASCYTASTRRMPDRLEPFEYPDHFETRFVGSNGGIRWKSKYIPVSHSCTGENIGLEEIDHGVWTVYFGPLKLGRLLEKDMRIEDTTGNLRRR